MQWFGQGQRLNTSISSRPFQKQFFTILMISSFLLGLSFQDNIALNELTVLPLIVSKATPESLPQQQESSKWFH